MSSNRHLTCWEFSLILYLVVFVVTLFSSIPFFTYSLIISNPAICEVINITEQHQTEERYDSMTNKWITESLSSWETIVNVSATAVANSGVDHETFSVTFNEKLPENTFIIGNTYDCTVDIYGNGGRYCCLNTPIACFFIESPGWLSIIVWGIFFIYTLALLFCYIKSKCYLYRWKNRSYKQLDLAMQRL